MFAPSNYSNLRVTFPVKMFRAQDSCKFCNLHYISFYIIRLVPEIQELFETKLCRGKKSPVFRCLDL